MLPECVLAGRERKVEGVRPGVGDIDRLGLSVGLVVMVEHEDSAIGVVREGGRVQENGNLSVRQIRDQWRAINSQGKL